MSLLSNPPPSQRKKSLTVALKTIQSFSQRYLQHLPLPHAGPDFAKNLHKRCIWFISLHYQYSSHFLSDTDYSYEMPEIFWQFENSHPQLYHGRIVNDCKINLEEISEHDTLLIPRHHHHHQAQHQPTLPTTLIQDGSSWSSRLRPTALELFFFETWFSSCQSGWNEKLKMWRFQLVITGLSCDFY